MWCFSICRGVPRGPHIPLDKLGGQGKGLEGRQRHKDKYYPFCQKQGICTLKNDTKKGNMEPKFEFQAQMAHEGHCWKEEEEHKVKKHMEETFTLISQPHTFYIPILPLTSPYTFISLSFHLPSHFLLHISAKTLKTLPIHLPPLIILINSPSFNSSLSLSNIFTTINLIPKYLIIFPSSLSLPLILSTQFFSF